MCSDVFGVGLLRGGIVFLEELMHAYQHQGVSSEEFRQNQLNYEIEAKMAWLLYLERNMGPDFDIWKYNDALGGSDGALAFIGLMSCLKENISTENLYFQGSYLDALNSLRNITSYSKSNEHAEEMNFGNLDYLMKNC